ncbi:MAG: type II toxin-antitoxin system RelE/ParE family toxin [Chloroflexi bacterium]|nr:type II toxin-antitoxin system RelE/ParE family toxin [Chloroflexota bacterium]
MHSVHIAGPAEKQIDNLPDQTAKRIQAAIVALAQNPRPPGCKKLRAQPPLYRIRVGDYRVVYDVDDQAQTVLVLHIKHRKHVYRDL